MTQAKLNQHCVNSADLYTVPPTSVPNLGGFDVVVAIGLQECQRSKPLYQLAACLGPREALQQFLENQTCCEHLICSFKSSSKYFYSLSRGLCVAAKRERPD
jgi:hypothetical protein